MWKESTTSDRIEVAKEMMKETGQKIAGGFVYKNVSLQELYAGHFKAIGEITNNSGKSYDGAMFKISFYDKNGVLVSIGDILILSFRNGQTKSFDVLVEGNHSKIDGYKIDFEGGY
jgi:hypothetical protein